MNGPPSTSVSFMFKIKLLFNIFEREISKLINCRNEKFCYCSYDLCNASIKYSGNIQMFISAQYNKINNFLYLRACDEFDYTIIKSSRLMTIVVLTCLPCTRINNILYVVWCSQ